MEFNLVLDLVESVTQMHVEFNILYSNVKYSILEVKITRPMRQHTGPYFRTSRTTTDTINLYTGDHWQWPNARVDLILFSYWKFGIEHHFVESVNTNACSSIFREQV
jgi:hypothetical protein